MLPSSATLAESWAKPRKKASAPEAPIVPSLGERSRSRASQLRQVKQKGGEAVAPIPLCCWKPGQVFRVQVYGVPRRPVLAPQQPRLQFLPCDAWPPKDRRPPEMQPKKRHRSEDQVHTRSDAPPRLLSVPLAWPACQSCGNIACRQSRRCHCHSDDTQKLGP